MGILDLLNVRQTREKVARTVGSGVAHSQLGILSPLAAPANLSPIVVDELWGDDVPTEFPLTRLEAMRVPAVAKGRAILHSLFGRYPLVAFRGEDRLADQPTWLYRSDTGISPVRRTLDILDDHYFAEASLLATSRGTDGQIIDAVHVPYDRWRVNGAGVIEVSDADGQWVPAEEGAVVWIPGPWLGLLIHGRDTIRAARDMDLAWMRRVKHPVPPMEMRQLEPGTLEKHEVQEYLTAIRKALASDGAAVFFTPPEVELKDHKAGATDLFETGRNAIRLDFANLINIPAAMLDGSVSTASLTYSTQEGRRNELFDFTVPFWATSIEQGLSLDNVVPRGQRVAFDFTTLLSTTATPTGANTED